MTKRYIHNLTEKVFYDKGEDEWFGGFNKREVEEAFSLIEDELILAEHYLLKNEIGSCLDLLSTLREKL